MTKLVLSIFHQNSEGKMQTTHFLLPEFEQNSAVDLINIYNKAIESIDINLFNTQKIAKAKVASNGIIYFTR
jgi:hypothetical protein